MGKNKARDWEIRLEIGQTGTEQSIARELVCLLEKSLRAQVESKGTNSPGGTVVDTDV